MKFGEIDVQPIAPIITAKCRECGHKLVEVPNGFLDSALYCRNCESIYQIKIVKISAHKVNEEFLNQCRKSVKENS